MRFYLNNIDYLYTKLYNTTLCYLSEIPSLAWTMSQARAHNPAGVQRSVSLTLNIMPVNDRRRLRGFYYPPLGTIL
jgi:hypothetical protein